MKTGILAVIVSLMPLASMLGDEVSAPGAPSISETSRCKLVSSKLDQTSKVAEFTFESATGIFTFDYAAPTATVKKVRLIILKEKMCEGFSFKPRTGNAVDLKELEGCNIQRLGDSLTVDLTGTALQTLNGGGKVQFINAYR
jgi:hypothetical protein